MKIEKTIQKILTKLDGKSVPYSKIRPMMRYITKDLDRHCPLYDVQDYVHLTRTVNDVVKGPTKVEYDEPTTVVMRKDSLKAIELLSENEKQKLYKELKSLKLYIYIPESLRTFWRTVAEWQPPSLQWAL